MKHNNFTVQRLLAVKLTKLVVLQIPNTADKLFIVHDVQRADILTNIIRMQ